MCQAAPLVYACLVVVGDGGRVVGGGSDSPPPTTKCTYDSAPRVPPRPHINNQEARFDRTIPKKSECSDDQSRITNVVQPLQKWRDEVEKREKRAAAKRPVTLRNDEDSQFAIERPRDRLGTPSMSDGYPFHERRG